MDDPEKKLHPSLRKLSLCFETSLWMNASLRRKERDMKKHWHIGF